MRSRFTIMLLLISILAVCLGTRPIVSAADESPKDLDILFLIDQSGSMGFGSPNIAPNDPLSLRFFGPRFAMQWLGGDRLAIHRESIFRMAVLHFGSYIQGGMEWQNIAPETNKEWTQQRSKLEEILQPGDLAKRSLGDTNFVLAFQEAEKYFRRLGSSSSLAEAKKAIVVLTDGAPYVEEDGFSIDKHMQQVQNIVSASLRSDFGFAIYVVAIQENAENSWPIMKPYWDQITSGHAVQVHSAAEVGARFQGILQELTEDFPQSTSAVDTTVEPGLVLVSPFLQSLTFTFFKSVPTRGHGVLLPSGSPLIGSGATYEQLGANDPIEVITIFNPQPGYWTVTVPSGSKPQIKVRQVSAVGAVIIPPGQLTEHIPVPIEFTLLGSDGSPVPSYNWPIDIQAVVSWDGGSGKLGFDLARISRFSASFTPIATGKHQMSVSVTSVDSTGKPIRIFQQVSFFAVGHLAIKPTVSNLQTDLFHPTQLSYSLADASGQAVSAMPEDISFQVGLDSNQLWPLQSVFRNGVLEGEFVPIIPGIYKVFVSSASSPAQIIGQFTVAKPSISFGWIPDTIYQYTNISWTVTISDMAGRPPSWPDEYRARVLATMEDQPIAFESVGAGRYTAVYQPTRTGQQQGFLKVEVVDNVGKAVYALLEQQLSLTVWPSRRVELVYGDERQVWRTFQLGLPILKPTPWEVKLYLRDERGTPLTLNEITSANLDDLFQVSISHGGTEVAFGTYNVESSDGSHLRISGKSLAYGDYQVKIEANPLLLPGFVWANAPAVLLVRRDENPIVQIMQVAFVTLAVGVVIGGGTRLYGRLIRHMRSKNPCTGTLAIRDANNNLLWSMDLDPQRSNLIILRKDEISPLARLRYISVRRAEKDPNVEKIRLDLQLDTGGKMKNITLSPGDAQKLDPYGLTLSYGIRSESEKLVAGSELPSKG